MKLISKYMYNPPLSITITFNFLLAITFKEAE